ncbi:MAG: lolA [Hydrocarboniphaga sp.]|uniref:outer membrane lipoprotein chaperone LolA n=1 Tax=Hydrocarboniphaga sp. TaxID=2033016 RepID=UPI00262AF115|nr:outer membrane lipoprotein chaperone LolA [Hydrocarboniphaga sp.]MDB5967677.1 lolA [Hydrocarboniphaga sp.]
MSGYFMRNCLFRSALLLALSAAGMSSALANSGEEELSRFIKDTRTVTAHFTQVQINERGEKLASSSGQMILSRPGRFRWNYEQPYEQLMVCDGQKIWLYDPDLSQVTVRPAADTLSGTPAALLAQRSTLTDEFTIEDLGARSDTQGVRLKPRNVDGDFEAIEMWLRRGAPESMVFMDRLGNRTEVAFTDIKVNVKVDEALLKFTPPKNAEIVESGQQSVPPSLPIVKPSTK